MMTCKRGDVYWVDFGTNVGYEQNGNRPAIIVSNDICNKASGTVTVVPLTSKKKTALPTHVIITSKDCEALSSTSLALCEQVRTIDKTRIGNKMGKISKSKMGSVTMALYEQLGIQEATMFMRIRDFGEYYISDVVFFEEKNGFIVIYDAYTFKTKKEA